MKHSVTAPPSASTPTREDAKESSPTPPTRPASSGRSHTRSRISVISPTTWSGSITDVPSDAVVNSCGTLSR